MYVIVEGMPGTGKTTISKLLARKLNALYVKSTFSNTDYGSSLRNILNDGKNKESEFFYLIDLLQDELRIQRLLNEQKRIVRDKTFSSSLSHLCAHGFINEDSSVKKAIYDSYILLAENSISPDAVVYIKPDQKKIFNHLMNKKDLSKWDVELSSCKNKYEAQKNELEKIISKEYSDKIIYIDCFSDTVDNMCDSIIKQLYLEK